MASEFKQYIHLFLYLVTKVSSQAIVFGADHFPSSTHVGSDCSSVGAGAAFGGFIGGVLLTAALGYGVAVAVVYRVKREVTLDLRSE